MARKMTQKQIDKMNDNRIQKAFSSRCQGIQIPMMSIPNIFKEGKVYIQEGADDQVLAEKIHALVLTLI